MVNGMASALGYTKNNQQLVQGGGCSGGHCTTSNAKTKRNPHHCNRMDDRQNVEQAPLSGPRMSVVVDEDL
jgi:hypothetical protein